MLGPSEDMETVGRQGALGGDPPSAMTPGQDSPHGAQAAAIQLQLAEVGQVHPWGPQEREVGD